MYSGYSKAKTTINRLFSNCNLSDGFFWFSKIPAHKYLVFGVFGLLFFENPLIIVDYIIFFLIFSISLISLINRRKCKLTNNLCADLYFGLIFQIINPFLVDELFANLLLIVIFISLHSFFESRFFSVFGDSKAGRFFYSGLVSIVSMSVFHIIYLGYLLLPFVYSFFN
jgi:hypothetical protein